MIHNHRKPFKSELRKKLVKRLREILKARKDKKDLQ
jgi:hypothetical protein